MEIFDEFINACKSGDTNKVKELLPSVDPKDLRFSSEKRWNKFDVGRQFSAQIGAWGGVSVTNDSLSFGFIKRDFVLKKAFGKIVNANPYDCPHSRNGV